MNNDTPADAMQEEMINHELGIFIDAHGLEYPIASYFDADGEECEKGEAVAAVAGCEGRWFSLLLPEFGKDFKQ